MYTAIQREDKDATVSYVLINSSPCKIHLGETLSSRKVERITIQ